MAMVSHERHTAQFLIIQRHLGSATAHAEGSTAQGVPKHPTLPYKNVSKLQPPWTVAAVIDISLLFV
jgi:hypothetical protein